MDEIKCVMGARSSKGTEAIVWILDFILNEMKNHCRDVSGRVHGLIGLLKESLY